MRRADEGCHEREREREREVVCGQVWWPILGICPLHLTHPSAHSQQWTHTWSSGQPYCGARGAVGGSVPCSRVSPQSWYWRWREHLLFTPPTDNPCRTWESNRQPLGYKSNSLTIRPRLPPEETRGTFSSSRKHLLQIWWHHYLPPSSVLSLSVSPFASVPPPGIEEVDLLCGEKRDKEKNQQNILFLYCGK